MSGPLRKYLLISLLIHLMVFVLLWHSPAYHPEDIKSYTVTWVKLSRGDGGTNLKANYKDSKNLPQSTIREQKSALKDLAKDKTGTDLNSKKSTTQKTLNQKLSQKKTSDQGGINLKKTTTKKSTDSSLMNDALARIDQQLKQREVSLESAQTNGDTGQSPDGGDEGTAGINIELVNYSSLVKRRIKSQWHTIRKDYSGSLVSEIAVYIDGRGNLLRTSFTKGSGDGSFDASALRAIKRSAPFPAPPEKIKSLIVSRGFVFVFDPNNMR